MEQSLSEIIDSAEMIIVAIGNEWDWVKAGMHNDQRYSKLIEYCAHEENNWLLPIVEFEYAYNNYDKRTEEAYKGLRKLLGDKKFFLISDIFLQDALLNGFEKEKCVYPCGNYMYLQTSSLSDQLLKAQDIDEFMSLAEAIHRIIDDFGGIYDEGRSFYKPFLKGKVLYLNQKRREYSTIKYNESSCMKEWVDYTQFLSNTLGHELVLLELGVGLDYPTVIRWPFEKATFVNQKAHLIRVHEKLYHYTNEIAERCISVPMNSVDYILQESKGL